MTQPAIDPPHGPPPGHGPPTVTVTVFSPITPTPKSFTWPITTKVGDAAREAANAFGQTGGNPTFQKGAEILDRTKPLVAAGVKDGDELEIVDIGGGV